MAATVFWGGTGSFLRGEGPQFSPEAWEHLSPKEKNLIRNEVQYFTSEIEGAAAGEGVRVALDVGPLGQLLEPYGDLTEEEARRAFRAVFAAGEAADLVVLETFFDLTEMRLALEEAHDLLPGKPCFATMTFQKNGRTLTGVTVEDMAEALAAAGADAVGLNCSLGPKEALPLAEALREATALPLVVKPNAGMPDPVTGAYPLDAAAFAEAMAPILKLGVAYAGGCCGTDPEYVRMLARSVR